MAWRAPGELEQLLNRLPHAVLFRFQDESFPRSFRTKNPQFFSGNDWIDLDDLKAWLGQQEDLKHFLNEPTILDSWQLPNDPLGFVQSQSNYHSRRRRQARTAEQQYTQPTQRERSPTRTGARHCFTPPVSSSAAILPAQIVTKAQDLYYR
ncbi:hypothetical protein B0H10DRAFT_2444441 [Mycena sp. CBHHK59/15]|nr:hypothetical protein B0H10DRAFT_2444441 [Mycena sp. CBHHK59/15]